MTDYQKYYLDCYAAKEASILKPALNFMVKRGLGMGNRAVGLLGKTSRGLNNLSQRLANRAAAMQSSNMARRNIWNGRINRFDTAVDNFVNAPGQFARNAVNGARQFGQNMLNRVNQFGQGARMGASQFGQGVSNALDRVSPYAADVLKYSGAGAVGAYLQNKWQND